jgi:hypothetical protein
MPPGSNTTRVLASAILGLAVVLYAGAGRLITSRRPGNAVGWLLGLVGASVAASTFAEQYAVYGLATARGSVPGARLVGALAGAAAELCGSTAVAASTLAAAAFVLNRLMAVPRGSRSSTLTGRSASREVMRG